MDEIINKIETKSIMTVNLRDGTKIPVNAVTTDTYWKSGRKDCNVQLLEPLNGSAKSQL